MAFFGILCCNAPDLYGFIYLMVSVVYPIHGQHFIAQFGSVKLVASSGLEFCRNKQFNPVLFSTVWDYLYTYNYSVCYLKKGNVKPV